MTGSSEIKAPVTLVEKLLSVVLERRIKQYFNFQKNGVCLKKKLSGEKQICIYTNYLSI